MQYVANMCLCPVPFPDAEWNKVTPDQLQLVMRTLQGRCGKLEEAVGGTWKGVRVDVPVKDYSAAFQDAVSPLIPLLTTATGQGVGIPFPLPMVSWIKVGNLHIVGELMVVGGNPLNYYTETIQYTFQNVPMPKTVTLTVGFSIRCEIM